MYQQMAQAICLLLQVIPCILHMENRVGLKVLTVLLIEGLSNAKKALIFRNVTSETNRVEEFFMAIQNVVNTEILGDGYNPTQWQCPREDQGKAVGTITLDNTRVRKIMNSLDLLLAVCFPESESQEKDKWSSAVGYYRLGMKKLCGKEDFTDNMINSFQNDMDNFFQIWAELNGEAGISNYVHMLGSGHVVVYLDHWKNLYCHSQQGWEAFNALLKTFFFRWTQCGGAINKNQTARTRLAPIARWLQRCIVWLCGYNKDTIEAWCKEDIYD